jgi:hypothetical protein
VLSRRRDDLVGGDDSREASFNARGGGTAWEEVLREAMTRTQAEAIQEPAESSPG